MDRSNEWSKTSHIVSLDTLRGVASIAVVVHHYSQMAGMPHFMPHGYLAVDFFFILSGFVISKSYSNRLSSNALSFKRFLVIRSVRLLPLSVLGGAIGILSALIWPASIQLIGINFKIAAFEAVTLLPISGFFQGNGPLFPINPPAWSLFFELSCNFMWAPIASKFTSSKFIVLTVGLYITTIIFMCFLKQTAGGAFRESWYWGFLRISTSFSIGVCIYEFGGKLSIPNISVKTISIIMILIFLIPGFNKNIRPIYDCVCSLFIFPLFIAIKAQGDLDNERYRLSKLIGDASYPIYSIHYPLLIGLTIIAGISTLPLLLKFAWMAGAIAFIFFTALLAMQFYDIPVRTALMRWVNKAPKMARR